MESRMIEAFRSMPCGIYGLTAKRGTDLYAMIVSWVSQVSYSPPLLMVAIRRNRKALPAIQQSGFFSLSLLRKDQKSLVAGVTGSPPELAPSDYFMSSSQPTAPFFKGCLASWECRLASTAEAGDHILCIGEVQSAQAEGKGDPLTTIDYGKTYIGQF